MNMQDGLRFLVEAINRHDVACNLCIALEAIGAERFSSELLAARRQERATAELVNRGFNIVRSHDAALANRIAVEFDEYGHSLALDRAMAA